MDGGNNNSGSGSGSIGGWSRWQAERESGFRILVTGATSLAIAFVIYSRLAGSGLTPVPPEQLAGLANAVFAITAAAMAAAFYGAYVILRSEQRRAGSSSGLMSHIAGAFANNRQSWAVMAVASAAYWVFFAFLSQILVYRPDISFAATGIAVPSVEVTPCCGAPGYVPMLSAYITDHFLFLVIPANVILASIVSAMVGFNVALSVYAYRLRRMVQAAASVAAGGGKKTSVVGGIGAATGLFVGCPTCAGSMVSALFGLGVAGAAGTGASALAPFQSAFIAASIPALAVAPFLLARSIRSISRCGAGSSSSGAGSSNAGGGSSSVVG